MCFGGGEGKGREGKGKGTEAEGVEIFLRRDKGENTNILRSALSKTEQHEFIST
jgi:hypothetical protein